MQIELSTESVRDKAAVEEVVRQAFENLAISDHQEHQLVARLRKSGSCVPELSIVAKINGEVVGHILLTRVTIQGPHAVYPALSLAPMSVVPKYQNRGIGTRLIRESHRRAKELGFHRIVVVGHSGYYSRFGYEPAHKYGITFPFDVPEEHAMIIGITPGALDGMAGVVEFPPEFFMKE